VGAFFLSGGIMQKYLKGAAWMQAQVEGDKG